MKKDQAFIGAKVIYKGKIYTIDEKYAYSVRFKESNYTIRYEYLELYREPQLGKSRSVLNNDFENWKKYTK